MTVLDVAWWTVCVVLAVSGASKIADPSATTAALDGLHLTRRARAGHGASGVSAGRVVGLVEVVVGLLGLLTSWRGAAILAAGLYAVLVAVVIAAMRAGLTDCGCVGVRPRPPSLVHVALNLASAAIAVAVAVVGPTSMVSGFGNVSPVAAVVAGLVVAVAAGCIVAA